jgi:hypothetical protein
MYGINKYTVYEIQYEASYGTVRMISYPPYEYEYEISYIIFVL